MRQLFESVRIRFVEVFELLIDDYLAMFNDYEHVNRYISGMDKTFTKEQEIEWVHKKLEEKAFVYSMIDKDNGEFIGNIELMDVSDIQGELGIAITAGKQSMGYGEEAIAALADYGINQLGLKRIFLRTNLNNHRAIHVYEKCGFQEYDRNAKHVFMEICQ